jgi:NADP-dependent 3-hydroxy acid dehydrogenase YdfG
MQQLEGSVAVVTGAGSGIGAAPAVALAVARREATYLPGGAA